MRSTTVAEGGMLPPFWRCSERNLEMITTTVRQPFRRELAIKARSGMSITQ